VLKLVASKQVFQIKRLTNKSSHT